MELDELDALAQNVAPRLKVTRWTEILPRPPVCPSSPRQRHWTSGSKFLGNDSSMIL